MELVLGLGLGLGLGVRLECQNFIIRYPRLIGAEKLYSIETKTPCELEALKRPFDFLKGRLGLCLGVETFSMWYSLLSLQVGSDLLAPPTPRLASARGK